MTSSRAGLAVPQGYDQFVCPEALPSDARRAEQDIRLTTFIKLQSRGYVGDGEVIRAKRQFYEQKGCTETLRHLEEAEKAVRDRQAAFLEAQKKQAEEREAASNVRIGSCRIGSRVRFKGGWAVGLAALIPFENPAMSFDDLVKSSAARRSSIAARNPLHFDSRGGCRGLGYLGMQEATMIAPGSFGEGKFLALGMRPTINGESRLCFVGVQIADVACASRS